MTAEQLKASILQMAIEGRLVPQRDDEPAVDIAGEVPEDVPFAIPEKWKWVYIKAVANINGGFAFKSAEYTKNGVRVVRISDFNEYGFVNNKIVRYPFNESLSQFLLEEKNILLCMTGGTVGKSLFVEKLEEKMVVNQRVATIKTHGALSEYIYSVICAPLTQNVIQQSKNSTNDNISMETIKHFLIPLPPLAEQRRIVARLEELLPLVEEYGNAHAALKKTEEALPDQLRASLLQEAIQGKLVPQIDDEPAVDIAGEEPEDVPFAIPAKWRWVSLGDAVVYGKAEQSVGKDIPKEAWVLDLEDIQKECGIILQKKRNVASTSNKSRFYKGNVLYSKLRPYLNKVVVADEDGYCTTEIVPIDPRSNGYEIDADYLKVYIMSPYFVHYANERSYGVKMPRLGTKDAKAAAFPLPPLAEQRRIVARLEELLPHVDAIR